MKNTSTVRIHTEALCVVCDNAPRALGEKRKDDTNSFHKTNVLVSTVRAYCIVLSLRPETTPTRTLFLFVVTVVRVVTC